MNTLDARRRLLGRNVYKKTVEGNPAIAQGSLARMYPGITMQGWTEQDSTTGAQLFDIDEFLELPLEPFASYGNARVLALTLKPNTSYTLSSNNIGAIDGDINKNISLYFTTIDDIALVAQYCAVFDGKPVTKTSDEEGKLKIVLIDRENADPIVNKEKWVMLNEGDTALPYELYTGGAPSPSPEYPQPITSAGKYNEDTQKYEVEVKLTGKNLIDKEDLYSYEKLIKDFQGQGFWIYPIDIPDGTYTFSAENSPYTSGGYLAIGTYTQDSVSARAYIAHPSVATKKATVELSGNKCIFLSARNQVNDNVKNAIGWIQLEHGSIATEYEPYKEPQTVTITSDRPLTKWDKLTKKNGVWGWEYGSGIYTVTGEEIFYSSNAAYKGDETSDAWFNNDEMVQRPSSNTQIGYCEQLSWSASMWSEANDGKIGFTFNDYQIHMRLRNSDIGINAEDTLTDVSNKIKAYAAQKYQEGNPFIFLYETKEPVFVPLSETEHEQMNALHTNRPTTVLSNNQDCEMMLKYKTKKSLEVTA